MSIFQLPVYDVLFPHIFCYLDLWDVWRLQAVCRDLCQICWNFYKNICKSLDIEVTNSRSIPDGAHDEVLIAVKIAKVCTQLERFKLKVLIASPSNIEQELNYLLRMVAKGPSKISHLYLSGFTIKITSPKGKLFKLFSRGFSNVREMTLENIKCYEGDISTLWDVCATRGIMRKFHLVNITLPRGSSFLPVASHENPHLKHFCVAYCHHLTQQYLVEVFRNCSELKTVDVRCVSAMTDRALHVLAQYCNQLEELYVDGCPVSNQAIHALQKRGVRTDVTVKHKPIHKILGQI